MAEPAEDIPSGLIDEFAIEDEVVRSVDPDRSNISVLLEVQKYLEEEIKKGNTFDVLSIPQNATTRDKLAVFEEIAVHKGVVMHLRNIKEMIDNKVKELRNV